MPARSTYRAPVAQYPPYVASGDNRVVDSVRSAKVSPGVQSRLPAIETANDAHSRAQKTNDSSIAPSFQIPKSVNDSGGSLSELAAEETVQGRNSNDRLPQMGHYHSVNNARRPECGSPGSAICLSFEEAQPGGQRKAWERIQVVDSRSDVGQQIPGRQHIYEQNLGRSLWNQRCGGPHHGGGIPQQHEVQPLHRLQSRPAPILPPASSLQLPMALPSPPASNQASPPYAAELAQPGFAYNAP
ncbi:5421_t:CDS:2, partial [Scutellospora calospora]